MPQEISLIITVLTAMTGEAKIGHSRQIKE